MSSLFKRQNTLLNYSLHNLTHPHIIQKKFWDSYFLKNCFACSVTRLERTRPPLQPSYLRMEMFMLRIHTSTQCFE